MPQFLRLPRTGNRKFGGMSKRTWVRAVSELPAGRLGGVVRRRRLLRRPFRSGRKTLLERWSSLETVGHLATQRHTRGTRTGALPTSPLRVVGVFRSERSVTAFDTPGVGTVLELPAPIPDVTPAPGPSRGTCPPHGTDWSDAHTLIPNTLSRKFLSGTCRLYAFAAVSS